MTQLPTLVVCGLALLLLLESGRPGGPRDLVVQASAPRMLDGLHVAPARLEYARRTVDRPEERLCWVRDDHSVRLEGRDGVLRSARRTSPEAFARLALPGLSPEELFSSRATGRTRSAYGLAFEERVLEVPTGRLELWWSRELGAPLRVVRDRSSSREVLNLEAVDGAPPGRLVAN
jgi:hypothetical protein